ncbi:hypothetical protein ABI59_08930 [Acidobacteria bacterium Mor1]|nr:hypothetical protein ABI59_08930 [Acidobacteria bacterium Mor1]
MGADLFTLFGAFARHGLPSARHLHHGLMFAGSGLARLPLRLLEKPIFALRRRGRPEPEPLFIVGHWRSGTTHLHNLMSRSPAFGLISPLASGIPWELLTLGTWLRPLLEQALPEDRHIDRVAVRPDSPQEDEIPLANMQLLSVFHALYFPRRFRELWERSVFFDGVPAVELERRGRRLRQLYAKIAVHQNTPHLLIKNPVYTAQIPWLLRMFPRAKFVHIYRNPYEVFVSTVHYYRRMLSELALQPWEQLDIEAFVLEMFPRLMDRLYADAVDLPEDRFCEVRFDRLEADPVGQVEAVHRQLKIDGWKAARPQVELYLDTIKGYEKNRFQITDRQLVSVETRWSAYLQRWGFGWPVG